MSDATAPSVATPYAQCSAAQRTSNTAPHRSEGSFNIHLSRNSRTLHWADSFAGYGCVVSPPGRATARPHIESASLSRRWLNRQALSEATKMSSCDCAAWQSAWFSASRFCPPSHRVSDGIQGHSRTANTVEKRLHTALRQTRLLSSDRVNREAPCLRLSTPEVRPFLELCGPYCP